MAISTEILKPRLAIGRRIKLGKLVVSQSGKTMPTKLGYFLITGNQRGKDGNFEPDKELMAALTPEGSPHDGPLEIPVTLLSDDIEEVFPTSLAYYKKGGIVCRNRDGGKEGQCFVGENGESITEPRSMACPCRHLDEDLKNCKPNGILNCMIVAPGYARLGAIDQFRTTSWNSIRSILGGLGQIRRATNDVLTGFTLRLCVRKKRVTVGGKSMDVPVAHLELHQGDLGELQSAARAYLQNRIENIEEHRKMRARYKALLAAPTEDEDGEEQAAVEAEYYPEETTPVPERTPRKGKDAAMAAMGVEEKE